MEISPIYHNSRPEGKLPAQEATAFDFLDSLGIDYERVTHELADTMEKGYVTLVKDFQSPPYHKGRTSFPTLQKIFRS